MNCIFFYLVTLSSPLLQQCCDSIVMWIPMESQSVGRSVNLSVNFAPFDGSGSTTRHWPFAIGEGREFDNKKATGWSSKQTQLIKSQ